MILHTIISMQDVFPSESTPEIKTETINGGLVEYEKVNGEYKLRRLMSSDPSMYLDKRYQPTHYYS